MRVQARERSGLELLSHAAHKWVRGGERGSSCAAVSRSTTCMVPPQAGHQRQHPQRLLRLPRLPAWGLVASACTIQGH